MRLLVLNWRDVRSPRAGGAEVVTHEIARRLVASGHQVTVFTSRPPGRPRREELDGVEIVREGSELTTRLAAPRFARSRPFDLCVEEVNTLPYLAPLWSLVPVVLFVHQLAREVWWYEAPAPLAAIGYVAEPLYVRAYRGCPVVTVSASTRDDLQRLGLRGPVHVVPEAVDTPVLADLAPKCLEGRLVTVGRLVSSKRARHAIEALVPLRRVLPRAALTLVGDGPERGRLEALAGRLGVADAVTFTGRVPEGEKLRVLRESDLLVACSVREGWGLTVTEAARQGTPAVVYDVPGFRDSVVPGRTGLLVPRSPRALAAGVQALLADAAAYERCRLGARELAAALSWERTAGAFERVLTGLAGRA